MITITIRLPGSPTVIADMGQIIHSALVANAVVQVENDHPVLAGVGELEPLDGTKVSKEHKIVK